MSSTSTFTDLIEIDEVAAGPVEATGARITVIVSGGSFFLGSEILRKSKEVKELIDGLFAVGFPPETVRIKNVRAKKASGIIPIGSSAKYTLEIQCRDLGFVGRALDRLASARNCEIAGIIWKYGAEKETKNALLERCIKAGRSRAESIARDLGVKIVGLHRFKYSVEKELEYSSDSVFSLGFSAPDPRAHTELDFSHSKSMRITAHLEYRTEYET